MNAPEKDVSREGSGPALWLGWLAATLSLAVLYAAVFVLTDQLSSLSDIVLWALCNAVPHVLLTVPLVDRVGPALTRMSVPRAVATGVGASVVYVAIAYGATIFLLALTSRVETDGLWVRFFRGPALSWQSFQGLTYAALAITVGMLVQARRELSSLRAAKPATPRSQHWLVKTADGIVPIDPRDLVRVEADGEYSRLILPGRTVLSRVGLGECAERVAGLPFLRVHRSHLVNGDAIVRAESAGNGRIQLSLRNGDSIITSRDGARLVRAAAL